MTLIDIHREALGYACIGVQRRPYYSIREIRRGRNKGKFEIEYRHSATRFKKVIVAEDRLRPIEEYPMPQPKDVEYTYDNPCPKCGKWLFHSLYGCH
jgi:hypothetical protein